MTDYMHSGTITIQRGPEEFPVPGLGELEELQRLADKLQYKLERVTKRLPLHHLVSIGLMVAGLSAILETAEPNGAEPDRLEIRFRRAAVTGDEIAEIHRGLKMLMENLDRRSPGTMAVIDLFFDAPDRSADSIRLTAVLDDIYRVDTPAEPAPSVDELSDLGVTLVAPKEDDEDDWARI